MRSDFELQNSCSTQQFVEFSANVRSLELAQLAQMARLAPSQLSGIAWSLQLRCHQSRPH